METKWKKHFSHLWGKNHDDNYKRSEEVNKVLTVHGDNVPLVMLQLSNQSLALHAPDGFNNAKGVVKEQPKNS